MSIQSTIYGVDDLVVAPSHDRQPGFWARLGTRFIEAQIKAGEARVARELRSMSDSRLKALGLTDEQVRNVRATGRIYV